MLMTLVLPWIPTSVGVASIDVMSSRLEIDTAT